MDLVPLQQAAKDLGLSRETIYRLIRKYNLQIYRRIADPRSYIDQDDLRPLLELRPYRRGAMPALPQEDRSPSNKPATPGHPGPPAYPDSHYAEVAKQYIHFMESGQFALASPISELACLYGVREATIRGWLRHCEQLGVLSPAERHRYRRWPQPKDDGPKQ